LSQRHRQLILAAIATLSVAVLCLCLRPWYLRYVERDRAETCEKARFVIVDHYNHGVEAELAAGKQQTDIDYDAILLGVIAERFPDAKVRAIDVGDVSAAAAAGMAIPAVPGHTYMVTGLCRSGGIYTITIDEASHKADTFCDGGVEDSNYHAGGESGGSFDSPYDASDDSQASDEEAEEGGSGSAVHVHGDYNWDFRPFE
jgi:hypothetical protein